MDGELEFRSFRTEDFESLQRLWEITEVGGAHRGDDLPVIERTLILGGQFFIAEHAVSGQVVGTCWLTYDGRRLYLHHLAIHPSYQRRGLGRYLTEKAIRHAQEMNVQIKLEVPSDNPRAIGLYRSCGFHPVDNYEILIRRDTQNLNKSS